MKVKRWAQFSSDLPEDHIEDGPRIVQFGGKSVAQAIGEMLRSLGCAVDPPVYADEHGWELDARIGKRRLWCQVTLIEDYLFVIEDRGLGSRLFGRRHPDFLRVLRGLGEALAEDSRFHDLRWFYSTEVMTDAPGAARPVMD